MIIKNSKLTESTKFILENMHSIPTPSEVVCTGKIRNQHTIDSKLEFYSDGWGEFYLFGGHLMSFALIQADSFCSAYDIYLSEYVPCDEMESEDDIETGGFDSCGGYYNENTLYDIVSLNYENCTFDFDIKDVHSN